MATSPSKAEIGLPPELQTAIATPEISESGAGDIPASGRDALQALLAFSALHERVRQRTPVMSSDVDEVARPAAVHEREEDPGLAVLRHVHELRSCGRLSLPRSHPAHGTAAAAPGKADHWTWNSRDFFVSLRRPRLRGP